MSADKQQTVKRFTPKQRDVLAAVDTDAASQGRVSVARLESSRQGAAETASSLVRRGVLVRYLVGGRVHYGRRQRRERRARALSRREPARPR